MVKKRVVERVGIDTALITQSDIEELAELATDRLVSHLENVLGGRDEFYGIVSIEKNESVDVFVDIEVFSQNPIDPEVLAKIDEGVEEVLRLVRDELARITASRRCKGTNSEPKES